MQMTRAEENEEDVVAINVSVQHKRTASLPIWAI